VIDKGADLFTITDNILTGRIEDNSSTERKIVSGNIQESKDSARAAGK